MTRRHSLFVGCWIILVAMLGCSDDVNHSRSSAEPVANPAVVVTATAQVQTLEDTVELSAQVTPWAAVEIASETSGPVVALPVEVGDQMDSGDLVARIDDAEVSARVAQSEAALAAAEAQLAQARTDLERGELLATTDDISAGELDRLRLAAATAEAQRDEAEAARDLAREHLRDTEIRAPFAGVISERHVEIGALLSPGTRVARLVARDRVKVRAAASAHDRAQLRVGLPAAVTAHALPGAEFEGTVRLLGQETDPTTATYAVEVTVHDIASSQGELLPGMQGTVRVLLGERRTLTIPRMALIESGDVPVVFVIEGTTARRVEPVIGAQTPEVAEVISGLEAGDTVAIQGQHRLTDGDRVEVTTP